MNGLFIHMLPATESCEQLGSHIQRIVSTVPVLVYGETGPVEGLMKDLKRVAPGRQTAGVEVWVRKEGTLGLYHGPGDVDRNRVCYLFLPVFITVCSLVHAWFLFSSCDEINIVDPLSLFKMFSMQSLIAQLRKHCHRM